MTIENPPKLWAFTRDRKRGVVGEPDISAHDTQEHAEMCHGSPLFNESPVVAYVREERFVGVLEAELAAEATP